MHLPSLAGACFIVYCSISFLFPSWHVRQSLSVLTFRRSLFFPECGSWQSVHPDLIRGSCTNSAVIPETMSSWQARQRLAPMSISLDFPDPPPTYREAMLQAFSGGLKHYFIKKRPGMDQNAVSYPMNLPGITDSTDTCPAISIFP